MPKTAKEVLEFAKACDHCPLGRVGSMRVAGVPALNKGAIRVFLVRDELRPGTDVFLNLIEARD